MGVEKEKGEGREGGGVGRKRERESGKDGGEGVGV